MTSDIEGLDQAIALLEKQRSHALRINNQGSATSLVEAISDAFQMLPISPDIKALNELSAGAFTFISLLGTTVPQAFKAHADHYHVRLELLTDSSVVKFAADVIDFHEGLTKLSALDITINEKLIIPSADVYSCLERMIVDKLLHQPEQDKKSKSIFSESKIAEIIDMITSSAETFEPSHSNVFPFSIPARTA
ncbi:MAG: hypothetical protein EOO52_13565 [Gammaproteobacteria bacterium]|nr:MAG: hypothetical protein EOO52_13565 [Gammaproteobacteria bacterium]